MSASPAPVVWYFPLTRPHTGVALGNGRQGLLVWGEDTLRLTVARAGFWDRRGGQDIPTGTTFAGVRAALEAEDDQALATLFPKRAAGATFPRQLGGGRLELSFATGLRPLEATLDLAGAVAVVRIGRHADDPDAHTVRIRQAVTDEVCWIDLDPGLLAGLRVRLTSAFDLVRDGLMAGLGLTRPEIWKVEDAAGEGGGFVQTLPEDEPLAVAWRREGARVLLATALGPDARAEVRTRLGGFDAKAADVERAEFWARHWAEVARVSLLDAVLQRQYDYGLYRQAGLLRAGAPAATLQGAWMEDTALPPWSNDYHFNINVQLVYGAALATGRDAEMRPLWDMLRGWLPRLRELGEGFYGVPGAMILPHAVDDRCKLMGSFWAGTIDQACVAWMARMAYQYYQYTGDRGHLRELVWPLLVGAFSGYRAMLREVATEDGGTRFSLPISVSPEFGGSDRKKCWGRDASFQLAALHSTVRLLRAAAAELGMPVDTAWAEVEARTPPYALVDASDGGYGWIGSPARRIGLWAGKDLPESHRHHSHLAGIYPFCTVDPFAPAHQKIVARSLSRWTTLGAGNWTGWCVPWASILCSRSGLADAATSWLRLLAENFTNEGYATLHNADGPGVFAWDDGSLAWPDHRKGSDYLHHEVMQMDAAMGALSATIELLVSMRDGVVQIADRLPKGWREASFERVRVEGGFVVSGRFRHARADALCIESTRGGELRLAHQLGATWELDGVPQTGAVASLRMAAGGRVELRRARQE